MCLNVPIRASWYRLKLLNCTGGRRPCNCICDVLCSLVLNYQNTNVNQMLKMAVRFSIFLRFDVAAVWLLSKHGQGAPTASGCVPTGKRWQTRRTMKRRGRWLLSAWTSLFPFDTCLDVPFLGDDSQSRLHQHHLKMDLQSSGSHS